MKKIIIILAILGALVGAGWFFFFNGDKPKEEMINVKDFIPDEMAEVKRGNIRRVVNATGKIIPNREIVIKCKASGEITKLPFDVSDFVKKGDLLVKLDPVDEERNVRQSRVNLKIAENKLETEKLNYRIAKERLANDKIKAEADIKSAEIGYNDSKLDLDRARQLFEKDLVSQETLDKAKVAEKQSGLSLQNARLKISELKTRETELSLKKNSIENAQAEVETQKLNLSDAEQRLKDTEVYAPSSGVVSSLSVQEGQIVSSGTSNLNSGSDILTITDMSRVFSDVDVDESDIAGIKLGLKAEISTDSVGGRIFDGIVKRINPKGTRSRGVVNFSVRVEVQNKDRGQLRPEMSTTLKIILDERKDVLYIPIAALRPKEDKFFVKVDKGEGAEPEIKEIKTGLSDGMNIEVLSGIEEGDRIIISLGPEESRWIAQTLDKKRMTKWRTGKRAAAKRRK